MGLCQKTVPRCVFRAYDIRGIIGKELDEDSFYSLGLAIAFRIHELQRRSVFLGRDGRLTSGALAAALKQGLLESGIDVIDLGIVPTPVMYYATHTENIDCGLMVTGSHNSADYNGIKLILARKNLVQAEMDYLYDLVAHKSRLFGQGQESKCRILPEYMQRIVGEIQVKRPLKIIVDCGNGAAGPIVPQVIEQLGCTVVPLYCDIDGHFPNHHPDPSIETNLSDLQEAVISHQADLGLAFDGDADRLGLVTDEGEIIWPDRLMMLYAREMLSRLPGATVVFDVKCSGDLAREITAAKGIAKMCPTGHSIVKGVMIKENAMLAGEMSGHLFFKDRWYGFDDALYSACRLLEIISASPLKVSEQFKLIPNSVNTAELKIPYPDEQKFLFMQRFKNTAQFPEAQQIIMIDGMRVEFAYGWGLLRASNTTPSLIARFEADNEKSLAKIQQRFRSQIHRLEPQLKLPF